MSTIGRINKDGNEIPFESVDDIEAKIAEDKEKKRLMIANQMVIIRNEVRDRKSELTEKALLVFQSPHSLKYVANDIFHRLNNKAEISEDNIEEVICFIMTAIIQPLLDSDKVVFFYRGFQEIDIYKTIYVNVYQSRDSINWKDKEDCDRRSATKIWVSIQRI